ncbi:MAG: hypothetical protein GY906_24370 [bacterium]|nr:hypothetical protein [bacterium]
MAEKAETIVHTDGDPGDVLFIMPPDLRGLFKKDEFEYTGPGGTVRYKVKTVEIKIEQMAGGTPANPGLFWDSPKVFYGVSVVP